jgi:hypothetical protein
MSMKLKDFIKVICAAEHFKHRKNSSDIRLWEASTVVADAARQDNFQIRGDEIVTTDGVREACLVLRDHPMVRTLERSDVSIAWGQPGQGFTSSFYERPSFTQ